MHKTSEAVDVQIRHCGSIVMFTVLTQHSLAWVEKNVALEEFQWCGCAFAVEHRYAEDLAAAMQADGLNVD